MISTKKQGNRYWIPLKVCSRINKLIMAFVFSFLLFECNLFLGVGSCAKFYVLSQLIVIPIFFYPCLQLVYVTLYILSSPCLLVTLQLVRSKCYWLCFKWYFEWFRIGVTN